MIRKSYTKSEQRKIDDYEAIVKEEVDKLDPIGLFPDAPENEYKSEIRSIALRVEESWSKESGYNILKLAEIMYIVFAYMFDMEEAKPEGKYLQAAKNIRTKIMEKKK